jgi:hypothetical protein
LRLSPVSRNFFLAFSDWKLRPDYEGIETKIVDDNPVNFVVNWKLRPDYEGIETLSLFFQTAQTYTKIGN